MTAAEAAIAALRADDDELLHLAVPALEGFRRDQTALLGAAPAAGRSSAMQCGADWSWWIVFRGSACR